LKSVAIFHDDMAPTQNVLAVQRNPETRQRMLDALRWGLIPSWAKEEKIGYKTINVRVETVDTAASYRELMVFTNGRKSGEERFHTRSR
jgi:putative SOS response-associated peptidase YedK